MLGRSGRLWSPLVTKPFKLPATLSVNAWTGDARPQADMSAATLAWALQRRSGGPRPDDRLMVPAGLPNEWNWRDPLVGWGLVLPDDDSLPPAERALAHDAPEPIQRLLAARKGSPVLRWRENHDGYLSRYDANGGRKRLSMVGSSSGIGADALPRYLLLCASPQQIPWSFQYSANLSHYVGRLDLAGPALDNYVTALLSDWNGARCDPRAPLVWSVSHGCPDITWLMDAVISRKVFDAYTTDPDGDLADCVGLFDADATGDNLLQSLVDRQPALVLTTSHGMTGPLDDTRATQAQLGTPVDVDHRALDLEQLATKWSPNGAIWYSHACCSAGSDALSAYDELFDPASEVTRVLRGVAKACGARCAPLPQRLLGTSAPLRAFVGHVEPTFDWTLRDPDTGQPLTSTLHDALYNRLYAEGGGRPLGWALARVFADAGRMLGLWAKACRDFDRLLPGSKEAALYYQIAALDRQHTVILGDPTVALPKLTAAD